MWAMLSMFSMASARTVFATPTNLRMQVPAMPTGLRVVPLNPYAIRITWTDESENESRFEISNGETSRFRPANHTFLTWAGVSANTWMCFRIRAYNSEGNSAWYPNFPHWYACTLTPADDAPPFEMPFPCEETWRAATYPDHPSGNYQDASAEQDRPIDLNHDNGDGWESGRPVLASAAGTVVMSENTDWGNWIEIDHGHGWKTQYLHLEERDVEVDQHVEQGVQIGTVGDTGVPGSVHLHYGQVLNGTLVDVVFHGRPIQYSHDYNGVANISQNCT
jgi:hypothetical protein